MSAGCDKGGLPLISGPHANQVICVPEVEFRKDSGTLEALEGGRHEGQRVLVLPGDVSVVVVTWFSTSTERERPLPLHESVNVKRTFSP